MEFLTKERIIFWLERKCQEDGCYNLAERGYVYCINHLHGFPEKLPQEVIDYLKVYGDPRKNEDNKKQETKRVI